MQRGQIRNWGPVETRTQTARNSELLTDRQLGVHPAAPTFGKSVERALPFMGTVGRNGRGWTRWLWLIAIATFFAATGAWFYARTSDHQAFWVNVAVSAVFLGPLMFWCVRKIYRGEA